MQMAVKKILFAFYPLFVKYNHGIALLSALCKERGIETSLFLLDDPEGFINYLEGKHFDYVGFSCVTVHDYELSIPFIIIAKRMGFTILLGGVYFRRTEKAEEVPYDHLCKGEAETLPDFILDSDDQLFREKMLCEALNDLPLPDYQLFRDIPFERDNPVLQGKRILPYSSSRGCPFDCSFCEVKGQPKILRFRYKIGRELAFLAAKYGPDLFFITDELMPYYNTRWLDAWEGFAYPFAGYIRADIQTAQLEALHERGMIACIFGVESGDEEYRNAVLGKRLRNADVYRTVDTLQRLGIDYATFWMSGTPGETFAINAQTRKMARSLGGHSYIWHYENLFV
jgi:radical SAM superfamily enzyme YgiQ (UPF0313 family)